METYKALEKALDEGGKLHAFRSGGGLRVVRIEKNEILVGYGEHPDVNIALNHCAEDYLAGQRPYDEVYGKLHDHYLTGTTKPSGPLDAWLLKGSTFDAWLDNGEYHVELYGMEHVETPENVSERLLNNEIVEWEHRGYKFKSTPSEFNGKIGWGTNVISCPPGRTGATAFHFDIKKLGTSSSLKEAFKMAINAPGIEIELD